jgi:hypothetical protein
MQLPKEIEELHQRLNSPSVVEGKWYRRNHGAYELICYINNLSGLLVSGNLEGVSTFIERVKVFLGEGGTKYVSKEYAALVNEYLQLVGELLVKGRST